MAEILSLPSPSADQRRIAAAQFDRANQVIAANEFDYAIQLLTSCCKIDPGNALYRKTLRAIQKVRHKNKAGGGMFTAVATARAKMRLKKALSAKDYTKALELAEEVLTVNPWDVGTQMAIGKAFAAFGQFELG